MAAGSIAMEEWMSMPPPGRPVRKLLITAAEGMELEARTVYARRLMMKAADGDRASLCRWTVRQSHCRALAQACSDGAQMTTPL